MSNPDQDRARMRLIISGRVQGVFFRASAADYARKLGLTGYARNLPDGSVEIVTEGAQANLKLLELWAHQGPKDAKVYLVATEWDDFSGKFDSFHIA
jgi:acylphosphatase